MGEYVGRGPSEAAPKFWPTQRSRCPLGIKMPKPLTGFVKHGDGFSIDAANQPRYRRFLDRGSRELSAGHYPEALIAFRHAAQIQESAEAHFNLGKVYERTGDVEAARNEYTLSLSL